MPAVAGLALLGPVFEAAAETAPSAYDLLDRVRATYEGASRYEDSGSITIDGDTRWRFTTAYDARTGFLYRLDRAADGEREFLFWGSEAGEYVHDVRMGAGEPVEHLLSAILGRIGSGGRLGLAPAAVLLQGGVGIPEPEAGAVDGPLPCAEGHAALASAGDCLLLTGGALGGTVLFELWVDNEDRVRLVDVEAVGPTEIGSGRVRRVRALYETIRIDGPPVEVSPSVARLADIGRPNGSVSGAAESVSDEHGTRGVDRDPGPNAVFGGQVDVRLASLRFRALDGSGTPIEALEPANLKLRVNGDEVPIEALEWVESAAPQVDLPPEILAREGIVVAPPGKLVIFFVQADLEPSRAYGQMRMMPRVRELIDSLGRDDHMAVVSYDSHLKLRHDFSRDRDAVHEAIKNSIVFSDADRIEPGRYPSLARYLDYDEARKVAQPETALEKTARALERLPGEKVMVFLGFGLGKFVGGGVQMGSRYRRAAERLAIAKVTVFTLDVTQADAHSLEVGLKQVSAATGGRYYRTFRFPDVAVRQVAKALAGHWIVYFYEPAAVAERRRPTSKVQLDLRGRKGSILLAPSG